MENIFEKIDSEIPKELSIKGDRLGYFGPKFQNKEIEKITVMMDLLVEYDNNSKDNELFITHHPPLFSPKTPTYTLHSNWDIIKGGANDSLAYALDLEILDVFDNRTGNGRICKSKNIFKDLLGLIYEKLELNTIKYVNPLENNHEINKVAIVSGYGLSNLEYIKLAKEKKVDIFLSGDLTYNGAILAKNLGLSLIDINHYNSEVPGLIKLYEYILDFGIETNLIKINPFDESLKKTIQKM